MIRKAPIIDSPVEADDIAYALGRSGDASLFPELEAAMSCHAGGRHIYLTNSGKMALYAILKTLAASSRRTEVVLPAYTAGSLVVAVRKAGLQPVLCDISLKDFNSDIDEMVKAVSERTLAVVCIHMFGITMDGIVGLKERLPPDVAVIEDCAQAMGSAIGGKVVGNFGDVAFFSFNRGKNLSVCGGGCITTNDSKLSEAITKMMKSFTGGKGSFNPATLFSAMVISFAVNPYIYGACYGLISRFKETAPPLDFVTGGMDGFQAALGLTVLKRFGLMASKRHENGMLLMNGLKGLEGVMIPSVPGGDRPAFNRFPVVFKDRGAIELVAGRLWRAGIENSRMYLRPLHHMFDMGYAKGDFPNACYVAERLLTLPTHPSIDRERLLKVVDVIRGALK